LLKARLCLAVSATLWVVVVAPSASGATRVIVFPSPGSRFATSQTQISFRGVAPRRLGHIAVVGSRTGVHRGRIRPDSDGRGASFYPDRRFQPGESVTVRTALAILGARNGTFRFRIDTPVKAAPQPLRSPAARQPGDVERFYSRPDLRPAAVRITRPDTGASDIFLTPMHGPLQWGPMIVDGRGSLIWFKPVAGRRTTVADLKVQEYRDRPVLTWWQGYQNYGDSGPNEDVIVNRSYRTIATVRAGNGLKADIHDFTLTPQGTALLTAYSEVRVNASRGGGPRNEIVANCFVQEIDIPTGNVLFQWDSLDHVPLRDSYVGPVSIPGAPFGDYFHINSVVQDSDGNLIISARNTWAIYKVDRRTGRVLWELGGKHSSFRMGPGTRTAYQHDATIHPGGLISVFDNGDWPQVHRESRAVLERINTSRRTATLVGQFEHSPALLSPWEGSAQPLAAGRMFVGWGGLPYFTEFDPRGRQIFGGRFVDFMSSYRAYEHSWSAQPSTRPTLAVIRTSAGDATVYASWNGATDVSRWRVLAGAKRNGLASVGGARRRGFETAVPVPTDQPYFAVQAIGSSGQLLAQSRTIPARG
jgi:Arylsulfotransferase (ASST)